MQTTYVNIDDQDLTITYSETALPEGQEGHFTVSVTKELMDQILYLAGFREVK